ncbi:hypothetical protein A3C20_00035 [Candidatus Kaiserbacteria bacterium RIFCSPHIGHO2_02_FULL_55_25]|uniref:Uncharacterized protein n=1 Tax=Candidatus Kaiserbacteria bacterium RIFCSPHIGHO2_02_FULL_55_25 TaxID=1798498 RepID=A0A1F6E7P9_9BACT|nr:MAG: hypothetical protein A2764_01605 [Candidatus Kaiserbacteria bacterium RIFCSPHIGHO2_01_FULL_55_79]OGG69743.1 MAG: hypothetical protein A3C20_00035 [Candidatus Kaiserbacteria bacterium RIFCSPHIGHO2_02_FULL_55_25]OGG77552.1 MAG: hypothetical protein A3F56_01955 [Candidatus Kaiserbacteria bacterium RIFCSPHIGHO2_12_FULL_55_13]OGG83187.1 MAG: hypothetical protein A3A42_01310 [Candidatus Kaiserbacteria bacterium RIFCSPLOWO2_01_FULL_55_25]
MARKPNTLARRLRAALCGKVPQRCPFASKPHRNEKTYPLPPELRGLAKLKARLEKEYDRLHWRKRTFRHVESIQAVECTLVESLRQGRHCPKTTTSIEPHRNWTFSAW